MKRKASMDCLKGQVMMEVTKVASKQSVHVLHWATRPNYRNVAHVLAQFQTQANGRPRSAFLKHVV